MTRTQFILALLVAAALGVALGWFARGPGMRAAETRTRDAVEALKKMNADHGGAKPPPELGRQ